MEQHAFGSARGDSVPQQRIAEKLDSYMARNDMEGAGRHLLYWLDEARALGDRRGELMIRNELVGHFRKAGNGEQALLHAAAALRLVDELGFSDTLSAGTTYTNVATAYNAFGKNEESLAVFEKAAAIYEGNHDTPAHLLGGLYNNMALTCLALGHFDESDALYDKALTQMSKVENGELEQAITYLNKADVVSARLRQQQLESSDELGEGGASEEIIERYLDRALDLLNTPGIPHDGYYAFVCEKCAPVFGYYGYFLADEELRERATRIYERP